MNWKKILLHKRFRIELVITLTLLIFILLLLSHFLLYVENRRGVILNDPILNLFNPINLTWLIFSMIYLSIILAIFDLFKEPERLMLLIQAYILMIAVRIAAMYVVPLDPPQNMIALNDPFVQFFGTGKLLTKDLFFSGHTATLFLIYLTAKHKILKTMFLVFTIAVGISVLLQHVHYTADVLVAPFAAYGCYSIAVFFRSKLTYPL